MWLCWVLFAVSILFSYRRPLIHTKKILPNLFQETAQEIATYTLTPEKLCSHNQIEQLSQVWSTKEAYQCPAIIRLRIFPGNISPIHIHSFSFKLSAGRLLQTPKKGENTAWAQRPWEALFKQSERTPFSRWLTKEAYQCPQSSGKELVQTAFPHIHCYSFKLSSGLPVTISKSYFVARPLF